PASKASRTGFRPTSSVESAGASCLLLMVSGEWMGASGACRRRSGRGRSRFGGRGVQGHLRRPAARGDEETDDTRQEDDAGDDLGLCDLQPGQVEDIVDAELLDDEPFHAVEDEVYREQPPVAERMLPEPPQNAEEQRAGDELVDGGR